jgi:aryl-alcohol dehydrogenase-like predicted oxidoreductase
MIGRVRLAKSKLETSRLGFGTSRLHYADAKTRERLLNTAVDLGMTHIDTAPSYGDTLAESEIGNTLRAHRDRLVIATKYGIPPNRFGSVAPAAMPLRAARGVARKFGFSRARPPMTAVELRRSVEASLRRLRTDWIDILLLHEPTPDNLRSIEEIHEELGSLQRTGVIRHYGLAGAWLGIERLGPASAVLTQILQTGEQEWPESNPPDITYGSIMQHPQSSGIDSRVALDRLRRALERRPRGVVLVSTLSTDRLGSLARAALDAVG